MHVRVPVRWSTDHQCFLMATDDLKLGPDDRLEPSFHDLQMQGDAKGGLHMTIGAMLTRQS
jgi:hypothetical protein